MTVRTASGTPRNVRAEMVRAGRSQQDIADLLDLSQPAVSRRLSGEVDFSATELTKLAAYLSVPVSTFFDGERVA